MKKLLSLLLVCCMLASMMALLPSFAEGEPEGTPISTVDDFIAMCATDDSKTQSYYLTNDIDFGNVNYSNGSIAGNGFSGTLDGCGFSLLNVMIESGNDTGVFGTGFHGTLKNITIGSPEKLASITCTNGDKAAGAVVAALQDGDSTFENVTVYANLSGKGKTGMFGGFVSSNLEISFTNCKTYGTVSGGPVAGFVVTRQCDASTYSFINCQNNANVTVSVDNPTPCGGFYAVSWDYDTQTPHTLTFVNCVNNGDVTTKIDKEDRGSAAGFICGNKNAFNAEFTSCINNGDISADDGSAAGFAVVRKDGILGGSVTHTFTLTGCINNGKISCNEIANPEDGNLGSAAGLVALPAVVETTDLTMTNCINTGDVSAIRGSAGGLFTLRNESSSCSSSTVRATIIGCVNTGSVSTQDWRAGGIVGMFGAHQTSSLTVQYCYNVGEIIGNGHVAAGIVAELDQNGNASVDRLVQYNYNAGWLNTTGEKGELARIENGSKKDFLKIQDNCFLSGKTDGSSAVIYDDRATTSNNIGYDNAGSLLEALQEFNENAPVQFVADSFGINNGLPILSWQVPANADAPGFSEGSTAGNTISTTGITGYVSNREGAVANTSDLRFVLALDLATVSNYETLSVTVDFCDATGVVKSFTLTLAELTFYKQATAAGEIYTAAEGDALFGLVVTGVPNAAWDYVLLSVSTTDDGAPAMVGLTKQTDFNG